MSSKPVITPKDLEHIAKLSRLSITPSEIYIADQLSQAAEYVGVLDQLDTSTTPPTFQVNNNPTTLREDVIVSGFSQSEALSQAADTYKGYFKTTATIKK